MSVQHTDYVTLSWRFTLRVVICKNSHVEMLYHNCLLTIQRFITENDVNDSFCSRVNPKAEARRKDAPCIATAHKAVCKHVLTRI